MIVNTMKLKLQNIYSMHLINVILCIILEMVNIKNTINFIIATQSTLIVWHILLLSTTKIFLFYTKYSTFFSYICKLNLY